MDLWLDIQINSRQKKKQFVNYFAQESPNRLLKIIGSRSIYICLKIMLDKPNIFYTKNKTSFTKRSKARIVVGQIRQIHR